MMVVNKTTQMTIEEFEQFINLPQNINRRFELIEGEIVELSPTELHGFVALKIGSRILVFVELHNLGRVVIEARYYVPGDELHSYIPDVSFTSTERLQPIVSEGAVPYLPDLAVEVKSPDDTYIGMRKKAAYYLEHGTRMVWLVYPEKHIVEVYELGKDVQILTRGDTISGGEVLPGFTLAVSEIFPE